MAGEVTISAVTFEESNSNVTSVQAGENLALGDFVYRKASDGKYWKAINTDSAGAVVRGIAHAAINADAWGLIITGGTIDVGSTVTQAGAYVLSATAGKMQPHTSLDSASYATHIGYALSATDLAMNFDATGVTKA